MKKSKIIIICLAATMILSLFAGCKAEGTTKEDCMNSFVAKLNTTDKAGIGSCFVSGNPDEAAVEAIFPEAGITWSWSGGTGAGTMSSGSSPNVTVISISWQDMGTPLTGENWKMVAMVTGGGTLTNKEEPVSE